MSLVWDVQTAVEGAHSVEPPSPCCEENGQKGRQSHIGNVALSVSSMKMRVEAMEWTTPI